VQSTDAYVSVPEEGVAPLDFPVRVDIYLRALVAGLIGISDEDGMMPSLRSGGEFFVDEARGVRSVDTDRATGLSTASEGRPRHSCDRGEVVFSVLGVRRWRNFNRAFMKACLPSVSNAACPQPPPSIMTSAWSTPSNSPRCSPATFATRRSAPSRRSGIPREGLSSSTGCWASSTKRTMPPERAPASCWL